MIILLKTYSLLKFGPILGPYWTRNQESSSDVNKISPWHAMIKSERLNAWKSSPNTHKKSVPSVHVISRWSAERILQNKNVWRIFFFGRRFFFFLTDKKHWCADFENNAAVLENQSIFFLALIAPAPSLKWTRSVTIRRHKANEFVYHHLLNLIHVIMLLVSTF